MEIRIITDLKQDQEQKQCVNLLPFGVVGEINYKRELNGTSHDLVALGRTAQSLGGITFVGGTSDNCGIKRRCVFVFEGSKLCGICDMNRFEEKYSSACGYKIFNYGSCKIGVLVDKDLFSPEAVNALVMCDCGLIINLYEGFSATKAGVCAEFYSYVYGVDFIMLSQNQTVAFTAEGERIDGRHSLVCESKKRCVEVKEKRRGLFGLYKAQSKR